MERTSTPEDSMKSLRHVKGTKCRFLCAGCIHVWWEGALKFSENLSEWLKLPVYRSEGAQSL